MSRITEPGAKSRLGLARAFAPAQVPADRVISKLRSGQSRTASWFGMELAMVATGCSNAVALWLARGRGSYQRDGAGTGRPAAASKRVFLR